MKLQYFVSFRNQLFDDMRPQLVCCVLHSKNISYFEHDWVYEYDVLALTTSLKNHLGYPFNSLNAIIKPGGLKFRFNLLLIGSRLLRVHHKRLLREVSLIWTLHHFYIINTLIESNNNTFFVPHRHLNLFFQRLNLCLDLFFLMNILWCRLNLFYLLYPCDPLGLQFKYYSLKLPRSSDYSVPLHSHIKSDFILCMFEIISSKIYHHHESLINLRLFQSIEFTFMGIFFGCI